MHLSRYIHLNPRDLTENWVDYPYSSYKVYLGDVKFSWLDPVPVLKFFNMRKDNNSPLSKYFSYQSFVEEYPVNSKDELGDITID